MRHGLAYNNDSFFIRLEMEGASDHLWARLTRAVMEEIAKPDSIITLPDGLSAEEAEAIRDEWTRAVENPDKRWRLW